MPTSTWDIAVLEVVYFVPASVPVLYCLWKHRHFGLGAWIFLSAFVLLQIIGSILILCAGEHGTPSSTSVIIISVGLSPLMLGISGAVHEWTKMSGLLRDKKAKRKAMIINVLYHLTVAVAIAIYATGASKASKSGSGDKGTAEWKTGIVLLFASWLLLSVAFFVLWRKLGMTVVRALFYPIPVSLALLGMRVIYQMVATFNEDRGKYSPVTGSTALRVVFQFLPGALIVLAMVIGGVMSTEEVTAARDLRRSNMQMSNPNVEVGELADPPKSTYHS